ncbi:MAG: PEP-CTERM sorting domain-containing protein [Pirellulales bacterium]
MKRLLALFAIVSLSVAMADVANAANGRVTANLYQDVAGTAGTSYTLSGWAGAEAGYVGLTDPTVTSQFALDFFGAGNVLLNTVSQSLVPGLGTSGNPFGYNQFSVVGVAPAGTTTVRARATMGNAYGGVGGQAFVVDAFSLTAGGPNLLSNPDLDTVAVGDQVGATPVGGWHVTSSRVLSGAFTDGASSEPWCNVQQANGQGLFFKPFQGDLVPEPATAGLVLLGFAGMIGLRRRG